VVHQGLPHGFGCARHLLDVEFHLMFNVGPAYRIVYVPQDAEIGMSHIVISLMPARMATELVELFGYKGNRHLGLSLWQKAGGWTRKSPEPAVSQPRCAVDHTITGDQSGTVLVWFSGRGCAAQYLRHVASDRSDLPRLPF
jgi:hypothetical protein